MLLWRAAAGNIFQTEEVPHQKKPLTCLQQLSLPLWRLPDASKENRKPTYCTYGCNTRFFGGRGCLGYKWARGSFLTSSIYQPMLWRSEMDNLYYFFIKAIVKWLQMSSSISVAPGDSKEGLRPHVSTLLSKTRQSLFQSTHNSGFRSYSTGK